MDKLPKNLETFMQLSTAKKARLAAKIETIKTGRAHRVKKTFCYRLADDEFRVYRCYTIVLL